MKINYLNFFLIICGLFNSCCFAKEKKLGNNFILSEYDNEDIQIIYSEETCANSGISIVPRTVLEYAYNNKWIIAKSGSKNYKASSFWIIDKEFKVKIIMDNDSTLNVIKSHVLGPLDSIQYVEKFKLNKINLKLKKI